MVCQSAIEYADQFKPNSVSDEDIELWSLGLLEEDSINEFVLSKQREIGAKWMRSQMLNQDNQP